MKFSLVKYIQTGIPFFESQVVHQPLKMATGVIRSLPSVLTFLEKHRHKKEVTELIQIYEEANKSSSINTTKRDHPLVVFEGLDGSGKSLLSRLTAKRLEGVKTTTPPDCVKHLRPIFNEEGTERELRRAFYSLGNYIAALQVEKLLNTTPVVMDRFWHSTAANAIVEMENPASLPNKMFEWPPDLLRPDLVVFLTVSEDVRLERMSRRSNYTPEEDQLKRDNEYRNSLTETYKKMIDPSLKFVLCDGVAEDVVEIVVQLLNEERHQLKL